MFNGKYISLKEVIYRINRHPLLAEVEIGDIAYDAIDVINIVGAPLIYESKVKLLDVEEFRSAIPCDLLYVISAGKLTNNAVSPLVKTTTVRSANWDCVDKAGMNSVQLNTYEVKRGFMYFDFNEGTVELNYKAVALDEDGYPLIPDNTSLIKAIESAVKVNHFKIKVDMNEISERVLDRAERDYAWNIGQAQGALMMPDIDEMEAIKNSLIRIVHNTGEHKTGFKFGSVGANSRGTGLINF